MNPKMQSKILKVTYSKHLSSYPTPLLRLVFVVLYKVGFILPPPQLLISDNPNLFSLQNPEIPHTPQPTTQLMPLLHPSPYSATAYPLLKTIMLRLALSGQGFHARKSILKRIHACFTRRFQRRGYSFPQRKIG